MGFNLGGTGFLGASTGTTRDTLFHLGQLKFHGRKPVQLVRVGCFFPKFSYAYKFLSCFIDAPAEILGVGEFADSRELATRQNGLSLILLGICGIKLSHAMNLTPELTRVKQSTDRGLPRRTNNHSLARAHSYNEHHKHGRGLQSR
jgi:hypothetical protein